MMQSDSVTAARSIFEIVSAMKKIRVKVTQFFATCMCSFNVTMLLRTYYAKGLLFYITNLDQTAYIAIQVVDSTVYVIYKGDTAINTLRSDVTVDDGEWHYVSKTHQFCIGQIATRPC